MAIHLIELEKWAAPKALGATDVWPFFFINGKHWLTLPNEVNDPMLRRAMKVLQQISDKQNDYKRYLAREDYMRDQATKASRLAQTEQIELEKEEAVALAASETKRADTAEASAVELKQENARLKAMLQKAGH